jgi:hypothetical protein
VERSKQLVLVDRNSRQPKAPFVKRLIASVVGIVAVAGALGSCGLPRQEDDARFDELQAAFTAEPAVFEAAVDVMAALVADEPTAARIGYSLSLVCVLPEGKTRASVEADCRETDAAEEAVFRALPNTNGIVYQAKDGERHIFRFSLDQPPSYHIMCAPGDNDPGAFADDRGFRSSRFLGAGWSLLGPIPDLEDRNAQWLE